MPIKQQLIFKPRLKVLFTIKHMCLHFDYLYLLSNLRMSNAVLWKILIRATLNNCNCHDLCSHPNYTESQHTYHILFNPSSQIILFTHWLYILVPFCIKCITVSYIYSLYKMSVSIPVKLQYCNVHLHCVRID